MATKKQKPPVFYAGTLRTLWVIAILFAAFGAVGWLATFWEVNRFLAVGMSLVFLGVPLAAAAATGPLVHSKSYAAIAMLTLAIAGLAAVDAAGNTRAFWQFETLYGQEEVQTFNAKVTADTADAQARLSTAETALSAIVLKERECMCPQTRATDLKSFEAKRSSHLADKERALDDLREIARRAPPEPRLLPKEVTMAVAGIISFALIMAFLGTHIVAKRKLDDWHVEREAQRKKNSAAQTNPSKPRAPKPPKAEPFVPRVVN